MIMFTDYSFPYLCISGSLLLTAILMSEHLDDTNVSQLNMDAYNLWIYSLIKPWSMNTVCWMDECLLNRCPSKYRPQYSLQDIINNVKKAEFMSQILMYWVLHGYGILSVVTYQKLSYWYLFLTPLPTVFYVITLPFSIPIVQSMDEEIQDGHGGARGM